MRTETVTRLRAALVVDPYSGEATASDWDNATSVALTTLAPAEPRPQAERLELARNAVVSGFTLYLAEGADVTAADRMVVRGRTYDVDGDPALWLGRGLVVQTKVQEG